MLSVIARTFALAAAIAANMISQAAANCGWPHGYYDEKSDRFVPQPPCRDDSEPPVVCTDGRVLDLIFFAHGHTTLPSNVAATFSDVIAFQEGLNAQQSWFAPFGFWIVGFADLTEAGATEGFTIGLMRAEAVRLGLLAAGVPRDFTATASYGVRRQQCEGDTAEHRSKNRWVAIYVVPLNTLSESDALDDLMGIDSLNDQ